MHRFDILKKQAPGDLEALLREGQKVRGDALEGWLWHGLSLAMPQPLFSLFGRFGKTFHREPDGHLRGWNVRMRQENPSKGWNPFIFRGRPVTYGFYDVDLSPADTGAKLATTYPNAFLIDYGKAGNRAWDPLARVRDWVVGVNDDLLLGRMYLAFGGRSVPTPSYFALARGERLTGPGVSPPRSRENP